MLRPPRRTHARTPARATRFRTIQASAATGRRTDMKRMFRLTGLLVCGCLCSAASSAADPVLDWNAVATQVIADAVAAGRPGQVIGFDYAMVHIAMFDAV